MSDEWHCKNKPTDYHSAMPESDRKPSQMANTTHTTTTNGSSLGESTRLVSIRYKVAVVGHTGSGKTSLIFRFCRGRLPTSDELAASTLETDEVDIVRNGKRYTMAIYDTSGHEDYARVRALSYADCDVVLLCYALDTSLDDFLTDWYKEITTLSHGTPVILVGTKRDLRNETAFSGVLVTKKQGKRTAKKLGAVDYFECSALEEPCDKIIKRTFGRALRVAKGDSQCCLCC